MKKIIENIKARLAGDEKGFSLIDVVITVAIVVALSVGGFIAYNGIVDNARQAAVEAAASQVYNAALVFESDGDMGTNACTAVDEYNASSDEIKVQLMVGDASNPQIYAGYGDTNNTYSCN